MGGHKKILMSELKALFESIGAANVSTYIQSGNVIFEHKNTTEQELVSIVQKEIKIKFGIDVPVISITAKALKKIVEGNPYSNSVHVDQLHVTFLSKEPAESEIVKAIEKYAGPDDFDAIGKSIYLRCEGKYHQSKLSNNFFEKQLNTSATTRNWKTVLKLDELSS